jgi:predicted regulator of Ras-like GTPase activity (Roadblock/LC7/MglB family)
VAAYSRPTGPGGADTDSLVIPYSSIIHCVPKELWGKLAPAGAGAGKFIISRSNVLEQLAQGAVKVPFGDLRRGAPAGLLTNSSAQDNQLTDLPLADILAQLRPDSLVRRTDQVRVAVSEDLPDLFGARGERLSPIRVLDKKEAAASAAAARQNPPTARNVLPVAPMSVQEPPVVMRSPVEPPAAIPAPAVARGAQPTQPPRAVPFQPNIPSPAPQAPAPRPASPAPRGMPMPLAAPGAAGAKPLPKVAPAKPVAPTRPFPGAAPGQSKADLFQIPVDAVAQSWPEEIRQELARVKAPDLRLVIPAADICDGLKRRIVQFPWRVLRQCLQPKPAAGGDSPHDDVVLVLPLDTITPLFLEHIRSAPTQRKVADPNTITEFFRRAEPVTSPAGAAPVVAVAPATPMAPRRPEPAAAPSVSAPVSSAPPPEGSLEVPVAQVSSGWPDPIKRDIAQFNLAESSVTIPLEYLDAGLKTGKVEFTWRQICAWLKPASPSALLSINGELRVSFPLHLIAPLFLKRSAAPARRKARVDQEIPDLFSAGVKSPAAPPASAPAPAAPSPSSPKAPEARPVLAEAPAPAQAPTASRPTARSLAELFNEPDKRSWTPNDIVNRTSSLPGVAGALIALQDGLLVASCMPPNARTETIAAFVPQIFGRMSQYTRELQMGDASAVSFTVETCTLQVFSAGIIYFAALGKPGVHLPLPELQLIATELGRHTK